MPQGPPPILPQGNSQSNQNYDVNVRNLFKHFVTGGATPNDNEQGENVGIDDIRAQISVSTTSPGTTTASLVSSLNIDPTAPPAVTPNTTTPVLLAQESRCHAFYRILGLPVVNASASQFYNPGYDSTKRYYKQTGKIQNMTLSAKIGIAKAVGSAFETISGAREGWQATTTQIFSVPTSVEAGVLSLTSGTYGANGALNKRLFNVLSKVSAVGPFDYEPSDQFFPITTQTCLVGDQGPQLLSTFQDANANTILVNFPGMSKSPGAVFFTHQHIIAPFQVDPRIDFSIWGNDSKTASGTCRRIAVPFVPDASYLQVGSTSIAESPLIEGIIRERMYQSNQTVASGQSVANVQALIQNNPMIGTIPFIGSQQISNVFSGSIFNTSQQNAFADTVSQIQTMIRKLSIALNKVLSAQGEYYWLPVPNTTGPEGGFQIRDVPLNSNFSINLITSKDLDIIFNNAQVLYSNNTVVASNATATPNPGNYAFGNSQFSFNKKTTNAQGNVSSNTMDYLSVNRNKKLSDAGDALQIIEMIMGEFSGLGLCDIIAIVGSLYTMPLEDLIGFLDIDAYQRALTILGPALPVGSSITDSMTSLLTGVTGFYLIMDQLFTSIYSNGVIELT